MNRSSVLTWTSNPENRIDAIKRGLSHLSLLVRNEQLHLMKQIINPNPKDKVLDVGISPVENMIDANYFEKHYPYPDQITATTVEDPKLISTIYPQIKIKRVKPGKPLPFKDKQFDIVTSWATLEHVGSYDQQSYFLSEILRVGERVFLTSPYRGCFYEPHSGFIFVHWLPLNIFRLICKLSGKAFWASETNLNPLYVHDIRKMLPKQEIKIKVYKTLGFIPSHIIIHN